MDFPRFPINHWALRTALHIANFISLNNFQILMVTGTPQKPKYETGILFIEFSLFYSFPCVQQVLGVIWYFSLHSWWVLAFLHYFLIKTIENLHWIPRIFVTQIFNTIAVFEELRGKLITVLLPKKSMSRNWCCREFSKRCETFIPLSSR